MTVHVPRQPIPFGHYLLLERIAVGSMCEVWRALIRTHQGQQRHMAVRLMLSELEHDEDVLCMFIDEAKAHVQLTHPNIVSARELGQIGSRYFLAEDYISGQPSSALFKRFAQQGESTPVPVVCHCIAQVCDGLEYAHTKKDNNGRDLNIVHRGLSLDEVLVSYEGDAKIIDFGLVKAAGRATRTDPGVIKGKFGYLSPEQADGRPVDGRSDVFSTGVCLFELLTGRRLFHGSTPLAVVEQLRTAQIPIPSQLNPQVPPELDAIVLRALARNLAVRYASAAELGHALRLFLGNHGVTFKRENMARYMRSVFADAIQQQALRDQRYASLQAPTPSDLN